VTDAAIIEAEYVEWKMVKTRKALQLIFEVPLEHQALVQAALGTPMPDTSTPVAIARMYLEPTVTENVTVAEIEPPRPQKSLAQIAGIICAQPAFWKYINVADADAAADYVRGHCNVSSRAALDHNEDAATAFRTLNTDYKLWLDGRDLAA
jgi:hypothetical protein